MTWLTPAGGLIALLALIPLAGHAVANRRVRAARTLLQLPPAGGRTTRQLLLLTAVPLLVGVAAAQPCLRLRSTATARTDAALYVVLDTSRSMAASPGAGAPSRLDRAKRIALAVRASVPTVPAGVATFTDRVLPDLFPTADAAAFDSTVLGVGTEDPPPRESNLTATSFDALGALADQGFFDRSERRRAVVLVTDGESRPFDAGALRARLRGAHVTLIALRVGSASDRVRAFGRVEAAFRPDVPAARAAVAKLGSGESLASALGRGPVHPVGSVTRLRALAPLAALLALVAFLLFEADRRAIALPPGSPRLPWPRRRRPPLPATTDA